MKRKLVYLSDDASLEWHVDTFVHVRHKNPSEALSTLKVTIVYKFLEAGKKVLSSMRTKRSVSMGRIPLTPGRVKNKLFRRLAVNF